MATGIKKSDKKLSTNATVTTQSSRQKKLTKSQKKQKNKKEVQTRAPLRGSFRQTKSAVNVIIGNWKVLGGIILVYLILNIVFASGVSNLSSTVNTIKSNLNDTGSTSLSPLGTALNGFGSLIASAGTSSSSTGSVLQTVLIILVSLVIIWTLRQLNADRKVAVKEAYYSSSGPLVPFLIVVTVIFIQFLPLLLGSSLVSTILSSAFVAGGAVPVFIFSLFFVGFALWSFYMISSSVFAMYIVTLPDMQPRRALRSAKNLVRFRRWSIMRKLLFLPIFIFVVMAAVVVPLILYATFLVAPVFFVLSTLSLLFIHTYIYGLYRNLLE